MRNSLLIRGVNERINGLSDSWFDDEPRELLCECGDESCIEAILVSRADYEVAMGHPGHYLVNSDHSDGTGIQVLMARMDIRSSNTNRARVDLLFSAPGHRG
jgi:hypothetical protein